MKLFGAKYTNDSGDGARERCESGEGGFTVIELLIAFTILAIVSGSLFQMFFVSARNNERAVDYDRANNLAITAAELFKLDPGLDAAEMFSSPPGLLSGATWRSGDGSRLIKYYDAGWRELEFVFPAVDVWGAPDGANAGANNTDGANAGANTTDAAARRAAAEAEAGVYTPDGARYILEANLGEYVEGGSDSNYVYSSLTLPLDAGQDYKLVINESAGELEAVFNGASHKIGNSAIGRIIPINVEYSPEGMIPKHIAVYNQTSYTVNVNVFGTPDAANAANAASGGDGERDEDARAGYVDVSPITGAISVMFLGDQARDAVSAIKTLSVSVRGLSESGAELARIEASKYVGG